MVQPQSSRWDAMLPCCCGSQTSLIGDLQVHVPTWGGWSRQCLREWWPFMRLALPSK